MVQSLFFYPTLLAVIVTSGGSVKKYAALSLQLLAGLVAITVPALAGSVPAVPEPSTVLLMGGGLAIMILIARKKRSQK
jgi:hypothetical protein